MTVTLADQYYLKALDEYPYALEVSIENLNYALSYNPEHIGANYLMGLVYFEQFEDYGKAEEYFLEALAHDPTQFKVCDKYAFMLIQLREYKKVEKLISHMETLRGKDIASLYHTKALLCEYQKDYITAKKLLNEAMDETYNSDYMNFLTSELERVEGKIKRNQKYLYEIDGE
ncbi:MAG: hypothetical protein OEW75_13930 [Cyclobacteriaceae bacterium]|nr:hypothetical protein [Cyclobacteriaceae bacterium]